MKCLHRWTRELLTIYLDGQRIHQQLESEITVFLAFLLFLHFMCNGMNNIQIVKKAWKTSCKWSSFLSLFYWFWWKYRLYRSICECAFKMHTTYSLTVTKDKIGPYCFKFAYPMAFNLRFFFLGHRESVKNYFGTVFQNWIGGVMTKGNTAIFFTHPIKKKYTFFLIWVSRSILNNNLNRE